MKTKVNPGQGGSNSACSVIIFGNTRAPARASSNAQNKYVPECFAAILTRQSGKDVQWKKLLWVYWLIVIVFLNWLSAPKNKIPVEIKTVKLQGKKKSDRILCIFHSYWRFCFFPNIWPNSFPIVLYLNKYFSLTRLVLLMNFEWSTPVSTCKNMFKLRHKS